MVTTLSAANQVLAPLLLEPSLKSTRLPRRHLPRKPRLSVVVVNYCQWEETSDLVRQLQASAGARRGAAEIMIVDNHSPRHPLAGRLRRRRGVSLRRWGRNWGYAKGVNEGCRLSQGDWLLLLNPDVSFGPEFLDGVLDLADRLSVEDPRAGVVGFQLRNSDGTHQLSAGVFPTLLGTFAGLTLPRARRKYLPEAPRRRSQVPWVTGCCFLARRDCLRQLGGFDEDFFLYYEDVDFCRRARARGWTVWYEPALRATHHHPLHARKLPEHLRICTRHALMTYSVKHWKPWQSRFLARTLKVEAWLRQTWARWRGDAESAERYSGLSTLVAEVVQGRFAAARRQLARVVKSEWWLKNYSGIRNQESGVRSRESGIRNQESGVRSPVSRDSEATTTSVWHHAQ